jgi:hypothetical protein
METRPALSPIEQNADDIAFEGIVALLKRLAQVTSLAHGTFESLRNEVRQLPCIPRAALADRHSTSGFRSPLSGLSRRAAAAECQETRIRS